MWIENVQTNDTSYFISTIKWDVTEMKILIEIMNRKWNLKNTTIYSLRSSEIWELDWIEIEIWKDARKLNLKKHNTLFYPSDSNELRLFENERENKSKIRMKMQMNEMYTRFPLLGNQTRVVCSSNWMLSEMLMWTLSSGIQRELRINQRELHKII
jgi:hypothetical protein